MKAKLPASISADTEWARLILDLASCLEHLEEDEYLILSAKRSAVFVQFADQGAFGVRAEAVGNNFIQDLAALLTEEQFEAMEALGWELPSNPAPTEFENEPPDGSPNFFLDLQRPVDLKALSQRAIRTLREVYGIRHPGNLEYSSFDMNRVPIRFPTLRLKLRRNTA